MTAPSEKRLLTILLVLSAITLISWWIGAQHGQGELRLNGPVTFAVLMIAAVKVRLIIREFMEARQAPSLLRRIADAWLVLLVGSLLVIYFIGVGFHASMG